MSVMQQILIRYSEGTATDEEIRMVEQWLAADESVHESFPDHLDKQKIGAEIRNSLTDQIFLYNRSKSRKLRNALVLYLAAACAVLGLWGIGFYQNAHEFTGRKSLTYFDNLNGSESKQFRTASGLVFKLAAHSSAEANTTRSDQISSVQFCGVMEITNETGRDIQVEFSSGCKNAGDTKQIVTCKEGKSYVALQDHIQPDGVIVVNSNRIAELPRQIII